MLYDAWMQRRIPDDLAYDLAWAVAARILHETAGV